MKKLPIFCTLLLCLSSCQEEHPKFDFIIGKWKVEGKFMYEEWKQKDANTLTGQSYVIDSGKKVIFENMTICTQDGETTLSALVNNQNAGEAIPFLLTEHSGEKIVFTNETHDFPNNIEYNILSVDSLQVKISGNDDKSFEIMYIRDNTAK